MRGGRKGGEERRGDGWREEGWRGEGVGDTDLKLKRGRVRSC